MANTVCVDYQKLTEEAAKLLKERDRGEHKGVDLYLQAVRNVLGDQEFQFQPGERNLVKRAMFVQVYSIPLVYHTRPFWTIHEVAQNILEPTPKKKCLD